MKIKCLIDHADVVFIGQIYDVLEYHKDSGQVRVEGADGFPVWLSLDYYGEQEYEFLIEDGK